MAINSNIDIRPNNSATLPRSLRANEIATARERALKKETENAQIIFIIAKDDCAHDEKEVLIGQKNGL